MNKPKQVVVTGYVHPTEKGQYVVENLRLSAKRWIDSRPQKGYSSKKAKVTITFEEI